MINKIRTLLTGEKGKIRNLVKVAYAQGKIDEIELDLLNKEINYLHVSEAEAKRSKKGIKDLWVVLPQNSFDQYKLIYGVARALMITNMLTDKKEQILKGIVNVFVKKRENVNELIHFLKYNIRYGNNVQDSFSRLGYLM